MIRLHITAEGRTEERFVNDCLGKYLAKFQVYCNVRCVLTSRNSKSGKEYRGGFRMTDAYQAVRRDIMNWLAEESSSNCHYTTMFDYYALPEDFPGVQAAQGIPDKYKRIQFIEDALKADIGHRRFIPYIQMHEFEALIFANPRCLDWEYLEHDDAIEKLVRLSEEFGNPELIDDSPMTARSKRLIALIPEHERNKTSGAVVASKIGIPTLKEKCPHFRAWIEKLEALAK